ncbi:mRNA 3'-end processing factor [Halobacteriales archaeon QS_3_64_16]|nr:MAG: mRNA 3'-end processing factor [Halobacteriales archaeon QS_3_64_16]
MTGSNARSPSGTEVRLRDGVEIELSDSTTVVADGTRSAGDIAFLSHAHGDHLYDDPPESVVCSALTAALAEARREEGGPLSRETVPEIDLRLAGHVAGSRAALITDPDTGVQYCYTGDISTRDRFYLTGFEPPEADVLIVETTYGSPEYVFPEQSEIEAEITGWLEETMDRPVLLFGYSLGRAQKLQLLAKRAGRSRVLVSKAIATINSVIEDHLDVAFDAERSGPETDLEAGDALVLPTGTNNLAFVDSIIEETGALKAGFSGWAIDSAFRYRGDYDMTFPLSDHPDFAELVAVVEAVDPEIVYTHHGFAEEFATHLTGLGYESRALKANQTALGEF